MKHPLFPFTEELETFFQLPRSSCQRPSRGLSISEDENHVYVDAHMPGVPAEEASVTIDSKERVLSICGKSKLKRENVKVHLTADGCYGYEIPLSSNIDFEKEISAVAKDGILSIVLPKSKRQKRHKIDVHVA